MQRTYAIHSKQPMEDFLHKIKAYTEILREFVYLRRIDMKTNDYFYGAFKDNTFKLVPRVCGSRVFLMPVFEGEIVPEDEGSTLHYTIKIGPDMKVIYFCIIAMVLIAFLGICFGKPHDSFESSFDDKLFLYLWFLGIGVMTGIFTAMSRYSMRKYGKIAFEKFSSLAEQSPDESHDAE